MLRIFVALLLLLASSQLAAAQIKAVASFSILGDMVHRVGGDRVAVTTIVGPESDTHVYEPTPADAKAMADADIVFVNGLGFEGWLQRLVAASGYAAKPVVVSEGVTTGAITIGEEAGQVDPHAWQDAQNARRYVGAIAKALCGVDAEGCSAYRSNAQAYDAEIAALDIEIRSDIERIPQDRRTIITSHDAFGYFARAYGVTFLAPEGLSTESEASAQQVAALIAQIRDKKAAALFIENITDPRLIQQIARETGIAIGGELYSDALSKDGGPAANYIAMMRHNATLLTAAMAGM